MLVNPIVYVDTSISLQSYVLFINIYIAVAFRVFSQDQSLLVLVPLYAHAHTF